MVRPMWVRTSALGAAFAVTLLADTGRANDEVRIPPPVSGRGADGASPLVPADVLARLTLLRTHVEDIRVYMGRPQPPPSLIRADGVQVPELFAQSLIIHGRVQQLGFEQLRTGQEPYPPQAGIPDAALIFDVLNDALFRVLQLKRYLRIERPVAEVARPISTTSTEVFNALLETGQLVHALLDEKTNASAVYSATVFALQVARVLHAEHTRRFLPDPPPFAPAKTPTDVYAVLLECFELARTLNRKLKLKGLSLEVDMTSRTVVPDDVLELAGVIISKLITVYRVTDGSVPPVPYVEFSRKFPSHSYQRALELRTTLERLKEVKLTPLASRKSKP